MKGEISKEEINYQRRKANYIFNQISDMRDRVGTGQLFERAMSSEGDITWIF